MSERSRSSTQLIELGRIPASFRRHATQREQERTVFKRHHVVRNRFVQNQNASGGKVGNLVQKVHLHAAGEGLNRDALVRLVLAEASASFQNDQNQPEVFVLDQKARARGFSASARKILLNYGWPGNVRELQNAVKHGAALAGGAEVDAEDLPDELKRPSGQQPPETAARAPRSLQTPSEMERGHILRVLDACGGSQSEAARVLGIARNTLWRKLRAYS